MKPELIDRGGFLFFELVRPLAAVFVLQVFPFRADAFLEEVVVGLESEFRDGCDVVLCGDSLVQIVRYGNIEGKTHT